MSTCFCNKLIRCDLLETTNRVLYRHPGHDGRRSTQRAQRAIQLPRARVGTWTKPGQSLDKQAHDGEAQGPGRGSGGRPDVGFIPVAPALKKYRNV